MGILSSLWSAVKGFFSACVKLVKKIINAVIDFFKDIVSFFKKLYLNPRKHVPFICDGTKLRELLANAPIRKVGVFQGVYDEETETITHHQIIDANGLDEKTKSVFKDSDGLVVLN
jgi:hypothetical protein